MPNIAVKKTYHVDLAELMRVYETNYAKLNALLPVGHEVGDVRCYQAVNMVYQLTVNEVTKYTTLIDICQSDAMPVFPLPKMSVRLYHDARVAEVCASGDFSRVKAKYDYPNTKLLQKDEKFQLNKFLGEWLTFCLKTGISRTPITF
ncbi:DUF1249 family protein [Vibrio splendidus]|uniref:Dehydrogenase n=1 Tax=Vibrio splendidus TaxID=29497 RepID=A0A2T5ETE8_VIBSP|nr:MULTISPECIES: DUF1249 family protein [Vibrio]MCK8073066.1 DUF1249 family protein [Vibrio sp. 1CM23M]OEF69769.1 dehydrogenase [Vibrio splendidus 1F-157]PMG60886.1 dehydrogenase [Vibrio splendidus]PMI54545.1 dehydrogenase [Vibrio splendidus]PTP31585.1 dehydrogenase [Vibrio splendidus]